MCFVATYQIIPVLCAAKARKDHGTAVVAGHIAPVHNVAEVGVDNMVETVVDDNLEVVVAVVALVDVVAVVHEVVVDDIHTVNYVHGYIPHFFVTALLLETTNCPYQTPPSLSLRVMCDWLNPS